MTNITIPKQAIELIKKYEGFSSKAYPCPANVWTIGYGTTRVDGKPVTSGMTCTEQQAEEYLKNDLQVFAKAVNRLVKVPLTENQFSALLSFTYNLGVGALEKSTLLKKLNEGSYWVAQAEFLKWIRAGGKILPGLVRRRGEEAELFGDRTK